MSDSILIAIDLSKDSSKVIEAGMALAKARKCTAHLVHVVQPISAPYTYDVYANTFKELEDKSIAMANASLAEIAKAYNIKQSNCHLLLGDAAKEVREKAKSLSPQLIVIGSHGHSGWRVLLGSTANSLLHGSRCDVYTVYIGDN